MKNLTGPLELNGVIIPLIHLEEKLFWVDMPIMMALPLIYQHYLHMTLLGLLLIFIALTLLMGTIRLGVPTFGH